MLAVRIDAETLKRIDGLNDEHGSRSTIVRRALALGLKRKPGRPPSKSKMVSVLIAFPAELLARIDARAGKDFKTRATTIRQFVLHGLRTKGSNDGT